MTSADFKQIRRALRLSQAEAARALDMPRAHVARIELGKYPVQALREPA